MAEDLMLSAHDMKNLGSVGFGLRIRAKPLN